MNTATIFNVPIDEQERAANKDGFSVWDLTCHVCDEALQEGDDCSQNHYTDWLLDRF